MFNPYFWCTFSWTMEEETRGWKDSKFEHLTPGLTLSWGSSPPSPSPPQALPVSDSFIPQILFLFQFCPQLLSLEPGQTMSPTSSWFVHECPEQIFLLVSKYGLTCLWGCCCCAEGREKGERNNRHVSLVASVLWEPRIWQT